VDYLSQLNVGQRQAVEHRAGPLLILAGAGAGKTRTICYRMLHLIKSGIPAHQILAITFTNKAAGEMRERVTTLLGEGGAIPFVSTFHALGVYVLRRFSREAGLGKYFSILDRDESLAFIKQAMRTLMIDEKRYEPRKLLAAISREKGKGLTASQYAEGAKEFFPKLVAPVWQLYEAELNKQQCLDFDDLLGRTLRLLQSSPEVLSQLQAEWQYIHIDEYQDTNQIQYELSRLLARKHSNVCVVGDIDQSIYSWRGADYTNILNFEQDYPSATVVLLEENYRSTQVILSAANEIIAKNKKRREKKLFTNKAGGDQITIYAAFDENDEARYIAETADSLIAGGADPEQIAVLYRANFQSRALEEACLRAGLPYQVLGVRFFERREIKDLIAYLRLSLNPNDGESLKRAINIPARGIGKVTIAKIFAGQEESLPASTRTKITEFRQLLTEIKEIATREKPSEVVKFVIRRSGLEEALKRGSDEDQERLENMREFATLATKYDTQSGEEGILSLIADAALVSDQDSLAEGKKGIRLMTVHASKGLEFDHVFVTGLEQDLFPHAGLARDEDRDEEEERRLFYVAVTRAAKKLFLTYAQLRTIYGSRQVTVPSEFLFDIPEELVEAEAQRTTNYIDF
jgi:DNA helicase II / ATP-dependent DNA helicase PcrA